MSKALANVASRLEVDEVELFNILSKTIMPQGSTSEQLTVFVSIANEYQLNPLIKEIYAFKANGGIQTIVSIDGWLKIINRHKDFDGMTFKDEKDDKGNVISITCIMHKKSTSRPVEFCEYLSECKKDTGPWNQWPTRMLRHKATIQAARYSFGITGIVDPDEADRVKDGGILPQGDVTVTVNDEETPKHDDDGVVLEPDLITLPDPSDELWGKMLRRGQKQIKAGTHTADQVIELSSANHHLTDEQLTQIRNVKK